jgi:hypothetical protein
MKKQKETSMHVTSIKKLAGLLVLAVVLGALPAYAGSPNVTVSGEVKDGSGHVWPLFAKLEFTSASNDPVVAYSDPVTGAYAAIVPDGATYAVAVTAIATGYAPKAGQVVAAGSPIDADWTLVASALCDAPGYAPGTFGPAVLSEGFDGGVLPAGWTLDTQGGNGWTIESGGDPCGQFDGNRTGGSGPYALLNSNCPGFQFDDASLVTPSVDLTGVSNAEIQWANDFINSGVFSVADVDVSIDGGTNWVNVWHSDQTVSGPGTVIADMSFAAGHANVKARFHYVGFFGWWWQVDDVKIGPFSCAVVTGGLLVGKVSDLNTGIGINGATIVDLHTGGQQTKTGPAPDQGDGFYSFFAEGSGDQPFEADAEHYTSMLLHATIVPDSVVRLDFALPAGILDASPRPLSAVVTLGGSQSLTLDVVNTGSGDGFFSIHEVDVPPPPAVDASRPAHVLSQQERLALRQRLTLTPSIAKKPPVVSPIHAPQTAGAGNVVSSFAPGLVGAYGLAYDTDTNRIWISNSDAPQAGFFGDGLDYEFQPDGTATGETIDLQDAPSPWQGDGTYNARTGMIWQTGVSFLLDAPGQCLFEVDPSTKAVTGKRICGPWQSAPALVGLAYDYATDTFYVGDQAGTITRIDSAGNVLDTGAIGAQISGLAYNPTTRHLFVQTFLMAPYDIYVVAPQEGYHVLSGFAVTSDGVPVLNAGGVSLESDCAGHLWVYDVFGGKVFEVESGEPGWCVTDIPWLSEDPTSGLIPASGGGGGSTLPVTVSFDSTGLLPGLRLRSLVFTTDTPAPVAPVPVALTVLFNDVPEGAFAWNFIHAAAGAGVMPGCNPYAPAYAFCPTEVVTRRSMAGFIERGAHGALTPPPVYQGEFDDVLLGSFNADYIQGLLEDGITAGCSIQPRLYCPDVPVTRAQMAVFVWKALKGDEPPPACTGIFADVPCPGGFAVDYIEGIANAGITAGCGGGDYCPDAGITNAQMAVFLVRGFRIPYVP